MELTGDGQDRDGSDGKSAYQVWKDLGNTGTEAQFIASLKGSDGTDGTDGQEKMVKTEQMVQMVRVHTRNGKILEILELVSLLPHSKGQMELTETDAKLSTNVMTGVTATGNQTVAGTKRFSSTISGSIVVIVKELKVMTLVELVLMVVLLV